jgi:hypothetical protein
MASSRRLEYPNESVGEVWDAVKSEDALQTLVAGQAPEMILLILVSSPNSRL